MNQKIALSKDVLYQALDHLRKENPAADINVKTLCGRAGINRSTFYVYYDNLSAFLREMEEEKAYQIIAVLERYPYDNNYKHFILENTFTLLEKDESLCEFILGPWSTGRGWEILCDYAEKRYLPLWSNQSAYSEEECRYLITYICSGGYGFLQQWYKNRADVSARHCRKLFSTFISQSLQLVHKT